MFKNRTAQNNEQALALIGMLGDIANKTISCKGRGAERMEAMAQVVAAFGFSPDSIKSVEIGWIVIDGEYCPTLKMESVNDEINEIVQIDR